MEEHLEDWQHIWQMEVLLVENKCCLKTATNFFMMELQKHFSAIRLKMVSHFNSLRVVFPFSHLLHQVRSFQSTTSIKEEVTSDGWALVGPSCNGTPKTKSVLATTLSFIIKQTRLTWDLLFFKKLLSRLSKELTYQMPNPIVHALARFSENEARKKWRKNKRFY